MHPEDRDSFVAGWLHFYPTLGKTYYIHDHLGSVRVAVKQNGIMSNSIEYEPFGEFIVDYAGLAQLPRLGWIGKERDAETDFGNFGVRNYEFGTGRFLSGDALWEEYFQYTLYGYSRNSPIQFLDASGLSDSEWYDWFDFELSDETKQNLASMIDNANQVFGFKFSVSSQVVKAGTKGKLGPIGWDAGFKVVEASVGVEVDGEGNVAGNGSVTGASGSGAVVLGPYKIGPQLKVGSAEVKSSEEGSTVSTTGAKFSVVASAKASKKLNPNEKDSGAGSVEWNVDNLTTISVSAEAGVFVGAKVEGSINIGRIFISAGYGAASVIGIFADKIENEFNNYVESYSEN